MDPKVFDGIVYHQHKAEHLAKEELTYKKLKSDLDADYLEGAAITNIARVLTKFVPELARCQGMSQLRLHPDESRLRPTHPSPIPT